MNSISVFCPVTSRSVETGIQTDWSTFFTVRRFRLRVRCTQCGDEHEISAKDGYMARSQIANERGSDRLHANPQIESLMARIATRRS